jgi:DNA-binding SARP family transcriptional activator
VTTSLTFRILGPVECSDAGRPIAFAGRGQLALFTFLVLNANRVVAADEVIDALWGDEGRGAIKRLQVAIGRLRRTLGTEALRTVTGGYVLDVPADDLDAAVFSARLNAARATPGPPAQTAAALRDALSLWRGPALAELRYEAFAQVEIRRLEELRLAATEARIDAELLLGRHADLIGELETLVDLHPERERPAEQLMLALYRSGRQAEALDVYARVRGHLVSQLGLEPGPALSALQAAVLAHSPALELRSAARPAPSALPSPLRASGAMVGRADALAAVRAAWRRAAGGERGLALVCGEAGIGKTRLASQLAAEAHGEGALVLYGRSIEDAGVPYEPWRQALGQLADTLAEERLAEHAARHAGVLGRVLPALARCGATTADPAADPEGQRYQLFDAVTGLVEAGAAARPVLLVLDDLHWSGSATLALLKHVHLAAQPLPLLIVGTYREPGVPPGAPLRALLGDLRREPGIERVRLSGLDEQDVQTLIDATAGAPVADAGLARDLRAETEGNPFFVTEIARHLADTAPSARRRVEIPGSVREVVNGRVARLGPQAAQLLSSAAVIGREFDFTLLSEVAGADHDDVIEVLDRAANAALVAEVPERPGSYTFVHALVSSALAGELSGARRARLHERIAVTLETVADPAVGELARHWAHAPGAGSRAKAAGYAAAAARAALHGLAPDTAVWWFERALEWLEDDAPERLEIALGLGTAQAQAARPEFRETLLEVAHTALASGDGDRLVRAALANTRGFFSSAGFVDTERVEVLEAALSHAGAHDARRARLLAVLAAELLWAPDIARRRALSDQALALARASGDIATLAYVLTMRVTAIWRPETLDERLEVTAEAVAHADRLDDPVQRFWARVWRAITLAQAGDVAGADVLLEQLRALVDHLRLPRLEFVLLTQEAWRAQLAGRLDEAERLAESAAAIGEAAGEPDAQSLFIGQLGPLRWHQGRLGEEADLLELVAEGVPDLSGIVAISALAALEAGREDRARAMLHDVAAHAFEGIPPSPVQLAALVTWGEVAARLGEQEAARALLARLHPFRAQVVLDSLGTLGCVARCTGLLAASLGLDGSAREELRLALETHERMGAVALAEITRLALAPS